jgi:hypothetical protein
LAAFIEMGKHIEALVADAVRDAKGRAEIERNGFGS